MAINTKTFGIFQSEITIRSMIQQGLAEIRAKPYLLDYCFASLPQDTLTAKTYGQSIVDKAKSWFLQQDIPVKMNTAQNPPSTFPCISIQLVSSNEGEKTLGDVHYDPYEDSDLLWPVLFGPFDAVSYDHKTGILVLPSNVVDKLVLSPGQIVFDKVGGIHQIQTVNDEHTVVIESGLVVDFSQANIKGQPPALITSLESVIFSETYQIGCHVQGEAEKLTWLHSIMTFIFLAYKETLLEARNFERSVVSSSDFSDNPFLGSDSGELVYSRFITLSGYVRQMWPGSFAEKITGVETQPAIIGGGVMFPDETEDQKDQESWIGDKDFSIFSPEE